MSEQEMPASKLSREEELDMENGGICIGQADGSADGQTIKEKWGNNTLDLEDAEFIRKF